MLNIWSLQIKGLQNYRPSNFENDWSGPGFEPGPTALSGAGAGWQTFFKTSDIDSQYFCSPLTYRAQIFSIKRSKPFKITQEKSRGQQHFKCGFCPLKVTSFTQGLFSNRAEIKFAQCTLKISIIILGVNSIPINHTIVNKIAIL